MNPDDLEKKQLDLQQEANKFLVDLHLMDSLSKFGSPIIVGSMASGLMTWPDIDVEVYSDKLPSKDRIAEFAKSLFANQENERIVLLDNTHKFYEYYPSGFHVMFQQKKWKVDIWFFLSSQNDTGRKYLDWLKEKLTLENRKIILEIKFAVAHNPKYRKEVFSVDIYNAVIENGVRDLEQFRAYLRKTNRSLD